MPQQDEAQTIYLTFDDGLNPTATPGLLDLLAQEQVVATFFLIDRHLTNETAPIADRIFAECQAVGLHTHTRTLMLMEPEEIASTLLGAADRIERMVGRRPCPVFRPHGGWCSGRMYEGLALIDHALVGWG